MSFSRNEGDTSMTETQETAEYDVLPHHVEARVAEGTARWVGGRMPHCPRCGGPLESRGTVGFYGNGDPAWYEACVGGCAWGQEVRATVVLDA